MKLAELAELALASGVEEKEEGLWEFDEFDLVRFAELVAAAEREACAKVCERMGQGHGSAFAEFDCAAAIRSME